MSMDNRGLRSIVEAIMTDIMYDVPSFKEVSKVLIDSSTVLQKSKPTLLNAEGQALEQKLLG